MRELGYILIKLHDLPFGLAEVEGGWPAGQGQETKLENQRELGELLKQSSSRSLRSLLLPLASAFDLWPSTYSDSETLPQVLLGLARYDGESRRDKATVVRLATTFLKAQQVLLKIKRLKWWKVDIALHNNMFNVHPKQLMDQNDKKTGLWIYFKQPLGLHFQNNMLTGLNPRSYEACARTRRGRGRLRWLTPSLREPWLSSLRTWRCQRWPRYMITLQKQRYVQHTSTYCELRSYLSLMRFLTYLDLEL